MQLSEIYALAMVVAVASAAVSSPRRVVASRGVAAPARELSPEVTPLQPVK